jgi:hypothetical protein
MVTQPAQPLGLSERKVE